MGKALKAVGAINGTTAYVGGTLVGRNVTITLPEVTYATATVNLALGEHEIALIGLVEAMESTIQKIGVDNGLAKMLKMKSQTFEFRWAQQVTDTDGSSRLQGCKAFIRGIPKVVVPEISVEKGEPVEMDIPLSVTRYQLFCEGEELILVDKTTGQLRINGEDYSNNLDSLL